MPNRRGRPAVVRAVSVSFRARGARIGEVEQAWVASAGPPRPAVAPARSGAAGPKPRLRATRPASASTSCRSSPARSEPRATGCPSAARTRCQPGPRDPVHAVGHLSASAGPAAIAVPPPPRGRQQRGGPSLLNAPARVLSPALSMQLRLGRAFADVWSMSANPRRVHNRPSQRSFTRQRPAQTARGLEWSTLCVP
jgi:hypothetical protein